MNISERRILIVSCRLLNNVIYTTIRMMIGNNNVFIVHIIFYFCVDHLLIVMHFVV